MIRCSCKATKEIVFPDHLSFGHVSVYIVTYKKKLVTFCVWIFFDTNDFRKEMILVVKQYISK